MAENYRVTADAAFTVAAFREEIVLIHQGRDAVAKLGEIGRAHV